MSAFDEDIFSWEYNFIMSNTERGRSPDAPVDKVEGLASPTEELEKLTPERALIVSKEILREEEAKLERRHKRGSGAFWTGLEGIAIFWGTNMILGIVEAQKGLPRGSLTVDALQVGGLLSLGLAGASQIFMIDARTKLKRISEKIQQYASEK